MTLVFYSSISFFWTFVYFFQITPGKGHTVVVISPTISLIAQQRDKLTKVGIKTEAIFGSVKQSTALIKLSTLY